MTTTVAVNKRVAVQGMIVPVTMLVRTTALRNERELLRHIAALSVTPREAELRGEAPAPELRNRA